MFSQKGHKMQYTKGFTRYLLSIVLFAFSTFHPVSSAQQPAVSEEYERVITVKLAQTTEVKIVIDAVAFQLEEVKVTSTPSPPTAGKQTLEALEIKRIPGTAGDALRALGALPGYNSTLNER